MQFLESGAYFVDFFQYGLMVSFCLPPDVGHGDGGFCPGVVDLLTEVAKAGDVEVTGLEVERVEGDG